MKKKEPVVKYLRNLLDTNGYKHVTIKYIDDPESLTNYSVGKSAQNPSEVSVEVGQRLLEYTTEEIKDTLLEIIVLLHVQYKSKCSDGYSSKHWKKWAKQLGHKGIRVPKIVKINKHKNAPMGMPESSRDKARKEPAQATETPLKPRKKPVPASTATDEADSVICAITTQTPEFDMGDYRIVRYSSGTIKVFNAKEAEVKAMGFLKTINRQFDFGLKTEGTNTRQLGKKVIVKLKQMEG
jgi:hypothetical protein